MGKRQKEIELREVQNGRTEYKYSENGRSIHSDDRYLVKDHNYFDKNVYFYVKSIGYQLGIYSMWNLRNFTVIM